MDEEQFNPRTTSITPIVPISVQQDGIDLIAAYTTLIHAYMQAKTSTQAGVEDHGQETI